MDALRVYYTEIKMCTIQRHKKKELVLMSLEWEFVFFCCFFLYSFLNSHLTISIATFLKDIRRESRVVKFFLLFLIRSNGKNPLKNL